MPFQPESLSGARLPAGLQDLSDPPQRLILVGRIPPGLRVAIVGTRRPTSRAARFAEQLARELSEQGVVVTSGGAAGIDTAAHRGTLDGPTPALVVGPAGFAKPYPPDNAELFQAIVARGGGYLSEFEGQVVARRHQFFSRNRILVALSHAVVLVQAPLRSGARNAASVARRLGRPLYVVLHPPWCSAGASCTVELGLGAKPFCSVKALLRELATVNLRALMPGTPVHSDDAVAPTPSLAARLFLSHPDASSAELSVEDEPVQRVRALLLQARARGELLHPEQLCALSGFEPALVLRALTHLSLGGQLEVRAGLYGFRGDTNDDAPGRE